MGNIIGRYFRVMTWGESHGPAMGAVVDGCPAGLQLSEDLIRKELARDVPWVELGTARREENQVQILSGLFHGKTLGTPLSLFIPNKDVRSGFYDELKNTPRPGHGDMTYRGKYGHVDWRGGSRASGRECIARIAAGAVAREILRLAGIAVSSRVIELAGIEIAGAEDRERAEKKAMATKEAGSSTGGRVLVEISGVPLGLGAPVFGKLEAELSRAVMSIGGVKSFVMGDGDLATRTAGHLFNDEIVFEDGRLRTSTNRSGGVLAGLSTGENLWFTFGVKPTPSIKMKQKTVDLGTGAPMDVSANGHFDSNFTPRAAVVAESMAALVLVDQMIGSGFVDPAKLSRSSFNR